MQCCTCSKWVHLRCSLLSFFIFKTLGSPHSWSCPPCCIPASFGDPTPTNTAFSSSDSFSLYISTVLPVPSGSPFSNVTLPPHPHIQIPHPSSAHFVSSPSTPFSLLHVSGCLSIPSAFSFSLTSSGFIDRILGVSVPGTLNCFTLSLFILLTLSVSRNLTLTHLFLFGSLDSLLCDLIAPTPSLAFFLPMTRTLAAVLLFSSGRAYLSISSLSSLDPKRLVAASNANLKPGGLLKWREHLVKDVRLSKTLNLCILFFLSLALLPLPTVPLPARRL